VPKAWKAVLIAAVLIVAAAAAARVWTNGRGPAGADGRLVAPTVTGFYLDIGASASLGFQPTGIPGHNGHRTSTGYANDVVAAEAAKGVALTMRQVGCPGETAESMLSRTKADACYKLPGGQLTAATQYLEVHKSDVVLVTIDLGFNDVRACITPPVPNVACINAGIQRVAVYMPRVLAALRRAAGPHVHFIGLLYGDPFLRDYLLAGSDWAQALVTLHEMSALDRTLSAVYRAAGIPQANVAGATAMDNQSPTTYRQMSGVPRDVVEACSLYWICTPPPWGPDDHPNNAGYRVIAKSILSAAPRSW
jgi:hypothetical protein